MNSKQKPSSKRKPRKPISPRPCENCGALFKPKSNISTGKYCSRFCAGRARTARSLEDRTCLACGAVFSCKIYSPTESCGERKCAAEIRRRNAAVFWNCAHCGREIESNPTRKKYHKFCSTKCQGAAEKALKEKHWSAVSFELHDPTGRTHRGKNLRAFVEENKPLFLPEDTKQREYGKGRYKSCRAYAGLMHLRRTGIPWKGWTVKGSPKTSGGPVNNDSDLTTEENAAGLAIWRWLPREFGTPLPELIPTK